MAEEKARSALLECCGSNSWAGTMLRRRPFGKESDLLASADEVWWNLSEKDWLEAIACHPQIGANGSQHRWSQQEQAGMRDAYPATWNAISELNSAYLEKFGYIYIVCATGKSGEEMLTILKERLNNDSVTEVRTAAEEQRKITRLRLSKMLSS